jgi:hypothetical protein
VVDDAGARLHERAKACDVEPEAAVRAARALAGELGRSLDDLAAALCEQLEAGVGLDAAVSSIRGADDAGR